MQAVLLAVCLVLSAAGAVSDIYRRRIPNMLCLALGIAAFAYLAFAEGLAATAGSAVHALLALLAGMALFRFGMIGAGDAKFYAAAALGVPLGKALPLLGWTSVAGLVLLLALAVYRLAGLNFGPRDAKGRVLLPYGVAIACGFWLVLLVG